ncbi:MAG: hypothetical protein IKU84_02295 [Clostridia bacterium]|nr:hypothetical protein [Clostridia bacterium]
MIERNCGCSFGCGGVALIVSIAIGVLSAIFRYLAIITVTPAFLWVVFGIAIGFLGISLLTQRNDSCECRALAPYLAGILGTILTSVILLGITFAATSLIGAIITGALLFFFSYMIINAVCKISCRCS